MGVLRICGPQHRLEWGLVYRRGDVYKIGRRGWRLLRRLDDRYPAEARVAEDRLWLKTQVGPCAVEPSPATFLPSPTSWRRSPAGNPERCI